MMRRQFALPSSLPIALLLVLTCPTSLLADDLGRLFFSPDERLALDRLRKGSGQVREVRGLTVTGQVIRSGGNGTTWINRSPLRDGVADRDGTVARPSGTAAEVWVRPAEHDMQARMKVGQTLDLDTGEILEGYQQNQRKPPPAAPAGVDQGKTGKPPAPTARRAPGTPRP